MNKDTEDQLELDKFIYGSAFYDPVSKKRIPPQDITVTYLANGTPVFTYGKMKPENIKVYVTTQKHGDD